MALLIPLERKHDIKNFWHYFAPIHGKGFVDDGGAAVKRMASNKVIAKNAETFSNVFQFM